MESLTCSGRFVSPFVRALASYPGLPAPGLARLRVLAATRVRQALGSDLRCSFASADRVARALHMSRRTLARRLDEEGTTFSEVLDTHRRELGVRYVARTSLPLGEISERLGFSQVQGFGRAFRRWTDRSPLEYRNAARKAAA
jgi:AraC-like DNA-binding protein